MIVRTEYSFRRAFGTAEAALGALPAGGVIADDGCWGHVPWAKAGKAAGKAVGFGARVRLGDPKNWRELIVVATSGAGLRDLYGLVAEASRAEGGVLAPRADWAGDWALVGAPARAGTPPPLPPGAAVPFVPGLLRGSGAAFADNFYPRPEDREAWLLGLGRKAWTSAATAHILDAPALRGEGAPEASLAASRAILERAATVVLPRAENVRYPAPDAAAELRAWAEGELVRRGLGAEYRERLERELRLVGEKGFADYFLVIADMIRWAKARMLVGPGRGSSAGSVVCWLLGITTVDPLRHGLLFERFIDVNRFDTPDIDIDFPDEGREAVLRYLAERYGEANVAHIGTVMRYKPKSALTDVAKELGVPPWELDAFKSVIIERSSGDSRVNDCLADTFQQFDSGRALLARWPQLAVASRLEGGARQSGKHAAGMIVCNEAVDHFCAVGARDRIAQIDKKSAEALNMLKIDALGLRTLSVLQTACDAAGIDFRGLYDLPLDDAATLGVFNARRWSGIFQFEGQALQSLGSQVQFRRFEDIAALTALARPGPLGGGEATRWIERQAGRAPALAPHPALDAVTAETYGTILYQEQVMLTTRELGGFSWADTAAIRKLMSNRSGDESFRKFEQLFLAGAAARGVDAENAAAIWKAINSFGSWAFNKSHAVVYGVVSYWCAWVKAHHPLAFALGCLRHARDDDSAAAILRELTAEGVAWRALDPERSREGWAIVGGELLGGLLGVPGIGAKVAREILNRRDNGIPLTPHHSRLLARGSVFENVFPTRKRFAAVYADPAAHGIVRGPLMEIGDAGEEAEGVIIARVMRKSLRDLNDAHYLARRGGRRFERASSMLILHVEDDTGRVIALVGREDYERFGGVLMERVVAEETYLMLRGRLRGGKFFAVEAARIWDEKEGVWRRTV
jgi:DNA polymerase III alpha subunit